MSGAADTLEPQRTSALGLVPLCLANARQAVVPMIAALFAVRSADFGVGLAMLVAFSVLVLMTGIATIKWWRTTYTTGPEDIRVESGVLSREARSVPYERIQDVSLEQGVIARIMGLVQLQFETGAGGKEDLSLAFLTEEEGERLRRLVRERREGSVDNYDNETSETLGGDEDSTVLFEMGPGRVALFGLFEFSLVFFGVLATALGQFDFLLPFDIWETSAWRDKFGDELGWLLGVGMQAQVVGAVLGLASVALIGVLTGVARTFAREYGFTLTRTDRGFRRRRGLFTRTDVIMPVHRVQAGIVTTGFLRCLWGWHGLKFVSLAQDAGSANHDAAPFAQMDEIAPIVREAALHLPSSQTAWRRPVLWRWFVGGMGWLLVGLYAAGMLALWGWTMLGIGALIAAIPLITLRQWLSWRQYRHATDQTQLYCKSGVLKRKLMFAPRQRVQSVEIRQGPMGLLKGYVDLYFGIPGGRLRFNGVPRAEAKRIRDEVLDTIATTDFSRIQLGIQPELT